MYAVLLIFEGRSACDCLGQEHDFMNNCMICGRIHCMEEGPGPCLFCGNMVKYYYFLYVACLNCIFSQIVPFNLNFFLDYCSRG